MASWIKFIPDMLIVVGSAITIVGIWILFGAPFAIISIGLSLVYAAPIAAAAIETANSEKAEGEQ